MVRLIIKKSGYLIRLPGCLPYRTPVDINISKLDLKLVKIYVSKYGIKDSDYEIKFINENIVKIPKVINKNNENKDVNMKKENNEIKNILKEQQNSILKIEELLLNFLSNNSSESGFKKEKLKETKYLDDFIPSININKMEMIGNSIKVEDIKDIDYIKKAKQIKKGQNNE